MRQDKGRIHNLSCAHLHPNRYPSRTTGQVASTSSKPICNKELPPLRVKGPPPACTWAQSSPIQRRYDLQGGSSEQHCHCEQVMCKKNKCLCGKLSWGQIQVPNGGAMYQGAPNMPPHTMKTPPGVQLPSQSQWVEHPPTMLSPLGSSISPSMASCQFPQPGSKEPGVGISMNS